MNQNDMNSPEKASTDNNEVIDEFWQWSCHIYQNKDIAKICLAVQDTLGLNVNYLLLAIWTEKKGMAVTKALWEAVFERSKEAEDAVIYIREKRIGLKEKSEQAYKQALLVELKAEQQHQKVAVQTIFNRKQGVSNEVSMNENLLNYLELLNISDKDQETLTQLSQLVQNISL